MRQLHTRLPSSARAVYVGLTSKVLQIGDGSTSLKIGRTQNDSAVDVLGELGRALAGAGLGERAGDRIHIAKELDVHVVPEEDLVGIPRDVDNITGRVRGVSILERRDDRGDQVERDWRVRARAVQEGVSEGVGLRSGEGCVEVHGVEIVESGVLAKERVLGTQSAARLCSKR